MEKKILVSNLDLITSEEDLQALFEEYGDVESAFIREEPDPDKDTFTGEVVMAFEDEAEAAVQELNGEQIDGRWLYVRFVEQNIQKEKASLDLEVLEEEMPDETFEVIQKKKRLKG